jgi:hypothetical protein
VKESLLIVLDEYSIMSLAALYNPLSENRSKLLVFYNAPNGRLNHLQWTAPDTVEDTYRVNDAEPSEKIPRLTALTTFIYKDTVCIVEGHAGAVC